MASSSLRLKLMRYQLPGWIHEPESISYCLPTTGHPKAPAGMVQITSPDQLVVGRRYRRYYLPMCQDPRAWATAQWTLDTRVFTFMGQDFGLQDSSLHRINLFDAGVESSQSDVGPVWNLCYLVEDPTNTKAMPVQEHKMEQYKFSHEELFTLLDPAIQLLKEAENSDDDHGESCLRETSLPARTIVLNSLYSRACGEWASAGVRYAERNPVTEVGLHCHAGLATLIQLKLLGCPWKTLRAALWQQTQPKTDLYLDRFLMVARYLYDNLDLLVKVAAQYPEVWTNLVDHLEPREVGYQWKRYAALRDIGLARQANPTVEQQKNYRDSKPTCNRHMKLGTYIDYVETPSLPTQTPLRESKIPCMSPSEEAAYAAEHLARKLDYSQPDCVVQFIPKDLSPCPKCKDTGGYLVVIRKTPATAWSLEVGCTCGWSNKIFFTKAIEDAFTSTNGAGYLAYWMKSARDACQPPTGLTFSRDRGAAFSDTNDYCTFPNRNGDVFPGGPWSYTVSLPVSDEAAKAIQDGTHPFVPPLKPTVHLDATHTVTYRTTKCKSMVPDPGEQTTEPGCNNGLKGVEVSANPCSTKLTKSLAEHIQAIADRWGLAWPTEIPKVQIGPGQPEVPWARGCNRALTAPEVVELYRALLISNEAADAVWKRITGEK